ncbi:MAG: peptidoglycan-binding protein [Eubacteriales bacterium]
MAVKVIPYVPYTLIVHLGLPNEWARNITVSFPDYVKNVASSEIFPTWEPAALRANILAIISYALNRVYTEFYPSQGYDFNITSTTAFDQKYTYGGTVFENISLMVDEIFNSYLRRKGSVEPLAAKFCNGTTTRCAGMSQWGSQEMALQGYTFVEILKYYYGEEVEIVSNAPVEEIIPSYSGSALRLGSVGGDVTVVQVSLNRISQNYPAIPKISPVNGVFGRETENAVKEFQRVFKLSVDGVVGKATWYRLVYLYTGVNQLSELVSLGQNFYELSFQYSGELRLGNRGDSVSVLQYMLSFLAEFNRSLRVIPVDGVFGEETESALMNYQKVRGLPATGIANYDTWSNIYSDFYRVEDALAQDEIRFPQTLSYQASVPFQYTNVHFADTDGGR